VGELLTLLSPFDYLLIRHPLKRAVDRWWTLVPALVAAFAATRWPSFNLFGSNGLVLGVNGLLQILVGFFITSLAVIATFSGTAYRIDDVFEGEAAILRGEPLTRRQFLSHLFAYLALASVILYLVGIFALALAPSLHSSGMGFYMHEMLRGVFASAYFAGLGHVIGTTLIGLIFLASRMSRVSKRDRFHAVPRNRLAEQPEDEITSSG
jgi:hypothetical protein